MEFQNNVSLKSYNTFGLDARATHFAKVASESDVNAVLQQWSGPIRILGGGSNLLLTRDFEDELILHNAITGIEIIEDLAEEAHIRVGAGVVWHDLVLWSLTQNLGGLENLSLIPGTVGAAPIQNIGAYGVELKDVFVRLEAIRLSDGAPVIFHATDCAFGYRDSIFKRSAKGQYCITRVILRLSKSPQINISYGAIRQTLAEMGITQPGIREVSEAVVRIRSSKLPDPTKIGNSGSFFKNPIIPQTQFETLRERFPNIVSYPQAENRVKVPAGWLIEQCGWKGKRVGNTGCYAQQALVLVNHGGATGAEVKAHAERIIESVRATFGITLEPEVNII